MRFYAVYRAVVRAKIAAIRADLAQAREYLALAQHLAVPPEPTLTITVGLSGSGKTTASSARLAADVTGSTLRLRSDIERKRLFGLAPLAASHSAVAGGIYTQEATQRTYAHLRAESATLLAAGWSVIVDAAFLRRAEREDFHALAQQHGAGFQILECTAPLAELRQRIATRCGDASEATLAVLDQQLGWFEPLTPEERIDCQQ
jgi:predicted kinase